MIQKAGTSNPRIAMTAAALVFGAVTLNPYSPPPAAGATMEEILAPATLPEQIQKAKEQCENINFHSRVLDWSTNGMATGLGLLLAIPGVPDVVLGFYKAVNPNTAINRKQIDCDAEVSKIEASIAESLPHRNLRAKRGLATFREANAKSKELAFHYRNHTRHYDMNLFAWHSDYMKDYGQQTVRDQHYDLLDKINKRDAGLQEETLNLHWKLHPDWKPDFVK